jgi:E3 ubiquitin-protein ligase ATL6/9/15/31/42/55
MALPRQHLALVAVLVSAAVAAQTTTDELSASPADNNSTLVAGVGIKVSFRPRVAIVVGIFTMIFSLTFLVLMYAKFCHPSGSSSNNGAAAAAVCSVGVPKQVIQSLPFFRFATLRGARQGMECSVCLARFDDADLLRLLPRCRHAFHLHCVDRWLQSNASCPLCRTSVDADHATLGLKYPSSARIVFGGDALSSGRFDDAAGAGTGSGRDLLDIFVERVPGPYIKKTISSSPPPPGLDRHKHRIIVSDVLFRSRWSELNSADLIALDTEMLRSVSSGRFVFPPEYNNEMIAAAAAEEEEEEDDGIMPTAMGRKRLLEPVDDVVDDDLLGDGCRSGFAVSASASAARMISSGVRSMSEIVSLSRERLSEEDNRRWLTIARRTARWFAAGRASRGNEEEHRAVHVVDDV